MQQLPQMPAMQPVHAPAAVAAAPLGMPAQQVAAPVQAPVEQAPVEQEIAQVAFAQGVNPLQFAICKVAATSSNARTPYWECTIEELRDRVTFRDVQGPANRDVAEYHCRPFLHPKSVDISALGNDAEGNPINTFVVPSSNKDALDGWLRQVLAAGYLDAALKEAAEEARQSKIAKDNEAKRAPVDNAAADAALSALENSAAQAMPAMPAQQAAPVAQAAPVGMPAMPQAAPVAQAAPVGMPAGMVPPGMPAMPQ